MRYLFIIFLLLNFSRNVLAATPLSVPTGFEASQISNDFVVFNWKFVSGASKYNIFRDGVQFDSTLTTTFKDESLQKGRSYVYGIQAEDDNGNQSNISASITVTAGSSIVESTVTRSLFNAYSLQGKTFSIAVTATSGVVLQPFTILSLSNPLNSGVSWIIGNINSSSLNDGEVIVYAGNVTSLTNMGNRSALSTNSNFSSSTSVLTISANNDGTSSIVTEGAIIADELFSKGQLSFPDLKEVFIAGPGSRVDFQINPTGSSQKVNLFLSWAEVQN